MMRRTMLAPILCILAGCLSQEQIAARQQWEAQQFAARQQAYRNYLDSQCRSIGYQEGTDGFRNCVLTLHTQKQQEAALIQQQGAQQRYQQLPPCSTLPPGVAGFARGQGNCR